MAQPTPLPPRKPLLYVWAFFGHAIAVLVAVGAIIAGVVPQEHARWVVLAGVLAVNLALARWFLHIRRAHRLVAAVGVWALALGAAYALFAVLFVDAPQPRHLPNLFWMYTLCHLGLWEAAAWWVGRRKVESVPSDESVN
jgi:hypothetical protein